MIPLAILSKVKGLSLNTELEREWSKTNLKYSPNTYLEALRKTIKISFRTAGLHTA
jgi:hypothetical protein